VQHQFQLLDYISISMSRFVKQVGLFLNGDLVEIVPTTSIIVLLMLKNLGIWVCVVCMLVNNIQFQKTFVCLHLDKVRLILLKKIVKMEINNKIYAPQIINK